MTTPEPNARSRIRDGLSWTGAAVSAASLAAVAWACLTGWGAIVHGHPAYAILLALTVIVGAAALWVCLRPRQRGRRGWRLVGRIVLVLLGVGWVALVVWLRPYTAIEPALTAMKSDDTVEVAETSTQITLTPVAERDGIGLLFQPGALVDPRAYAAVLRPLAEAGHTVVIPKQPLGVAFLAVGALDDARSAHPELTGWVVGGHSLGGTVAALEADADDDAATAPSIGLLFYASYPATDISTSLTIPVESISGSRDGLATPAKIDASRALLPADTGFTVIEGGVHGQFGDYGPQAGDHTPEISNSEARAQISEASLSFVDSLAR